MEELDDLFGDMDTEWDLVQDAFVMYQSKPDAERKQTLERYLTSLHATLDLIENRLREMA